MGRGRRGRPVGATGELGLTDEQAGEGLVKYQIRPIIGREIMINEGEGEELHSVLRTPDSFLAVVRVE